MSTEAMTDTKNTVSDELLPCPFCGGTAEIEHDTPMPGSFTLGCTTDGCAATMMWAGEDEDYLPDAIAAWNLRASIPGGVGVKGEIPNTMPGHWSTEEGAEMAKTYAAKDRSDLGMSHLTDLELANAIFMANRGDLDLIVYQTAAKERIRWLSAKLAVALSMKPQSGSEA